MPEPVKYEYSSANEADKNKEFDREVRAMVSAITHRFGELQKSGTSHQHHQVEDDQVMSIITLAGTNTGAKMRSELDDKDSNHKGLQGEPDGLTTHVNNNLQAINNSIMLGGSYTANDPGVHMDISDFEEHGHNLRKSGKGKKKEKGTSKSDHHSDHSYSSSD